MLRSNRVEMRGGRNDDDKHSTSNNDMTTTEGDDNQTMGWGLATERVNDNRKTRKTEKWGPRDVSIS